MAWEPAINVAFDKGNAQEFLQLLRIHPEYIRNEADGSDMWMWIAAQQGKLSIIQALVELGVDVNETSDHGDKNDPFYQPEGAIVEAAGSGHVEIVRWLLEHGARINYVVQGMPRCLPLIRAATNGHLEVVKLLVEHDADFHSTWRGLDATTKAEDFGHFEVRDYLRSLGARTLRETTPPDYLSAQKQFIQELTERVGPLGDWRFEIPGDPQVILHIIPANEKCNMLSLFTLGLSDHPLPQGLKPHACTELRCILPPDWPISNESIQDPNWNWPIKWLERLVQALRIADRWPDEPALFMNGEPPMPLAPNTQLSGWLALKSLGESVHVADYRWIDIHSLFPIYTEECNLVKKSGHEELVKRFHSQQIPLFVDPQRLNVVAE